MKIRERILEAAERLFSREGGDGLSIRRLAEDIDYSPAAIYKYFASKDALIEELKETFFGEILNKIDELMQSEQPIEKRMRLGVAGYVHVAIEKPHHYSAAFSGTSALSDLTSSPDMKNGNKWKAFAQLSDVVQEGIDSGALRSDLSAETAAKSIWASMHGIAMLIAHIPGFPCMDAPGTADETQQFIEYHADLVVRGLEVSHD